MPKFLLHLLCVLKTGHHYMRRVRLIEHGPGRGSVIVFKQCTYCNHERDE